MNTREEELFDRARLLPEAERDAFLVRECGDDCILLARLRELLEADATRTHQDLIDQIQDESVVDTDEFVGEPTGKVIGNYKLLQKIGEGGFGVVYMAEQLRPVKRKVALKVIKPGMDSKAVVARFESERQALAFMDHDNIAKVFDGGATDRGRPYFVMELVKGVSITSYCDKNKLSTHQRLALLVKVCSAVQHAHQKGIIHRDIKPSNVLVTLHDGVPVPKVIDFGVAKATNQQLTERTLFTAFGNMIGTPQYMSPEQAEMSGLDVDTRSDVYSLGVLLYELLTGTTPLDAESIRSAGYAEMQRMIQSSEPPKPSVRLSTVGAELTVIAEHRSLDPRGLKRAVQGELDWVAMKALEKDRTRRYESASHLAADLQRFLDGDSVEACPPSLAYRVTKFVKRNRKLVLPVAILGLLLAGWLATFLWQARMRLRSMYLADVNSATAAFEHGDVARTSDLLGRYASRPGLLGPEWFFLRGLCEEARKTEHAIDLRYGARGLDVSPTDGKLVVVIQDNSVAIVDVATGVIESRFGPADEKWILGYAKFSSSGNQLVVPDDEDLRCAQVLDWVSRTKQYRVGPHSDHVCSVAISPDDRYLVTTDRKGLVILSDLKTGQELDRETLPEGDCYAAFPTPLSFVTGDTSGEVRFWDIRDDRIGGTEVGYSMHSNPVTAIAISGDRRMLTSAGLHQIVVWDIEERRTITQLDGHNDSCRTLSFSSDNRRILSSSRDKTIVVWDIETREPLQKKLVHSSIVTGATFLSDHRVASIGFDGTLAIWQVKPSARIRDLGGAASGVGYCDGDVIACRESGHVERVSLETFNRIRLADVEEHSLFDVSPNGVMVFGNRSGQIQIQRLDGAQQPTALANLNGAVNDLRISPTGTEVGTIDQHGTLNLWETESGKRSELAKDAVRLAFSPRGDRMAWATKANEIIVRSRKTSNSVRLHSHDRAVVSIDFSRNGRWLATGDWGGTVNVWDLSSSALTAKRLRHPLWIGSVCFADDSRTLIVSCGDRSLRFWDIALDEPQQKCSMRIRKETYDHLVLSPDGNTLVGSVRADHSEHSVILYHLK